MELLCPDDASSVIARFLERRGEGVHHIPLEVNRLDEAIADPREAGVQVASRHR